jgi:hypothetical protein
MLSNIAGERIGIVDERHAQKRLDGGDDEIRWRGEVALDHGAIERGWKHDREPLHQPSPLATLARQP